MKLKIASEFSTAPGPRYRHEGKFSGEEFRTEKLLPRLREAFNTQCKLVVDLDGAAGYGTSFLEEAFGGLIRIDKISYKDIKAGLELISNEEPSLISEIEEYLREADSEC